MGFWLFVVSTTVSTKSGASFLINLDLDDAVFVQLFQSNLLGCHGVMNRLDGLQPIDYLRLALGVEDPENNEVNGHVRMALQSVLPELRIESAGALIDLG